MDTDDNETPGADDEHENDDTVERTKVISEDDLLFIKAFEATVAESVAVRILIYQLIQIFLFTMFSIDQVI